MAAGVDWNKVARPNVPGVGIQTGPKSLSVVGQSPTVSGAIPAAIPSSVSTPGIGNNARAPVATIASTVGPQSATANDINVTAGAGVRSSISGTIPPSVQLPTPTPIKDKEVSVVAPSRAAIAPSATISPTSETAVASPVKSPELRAEPVSPPAASAPSTHGYGAAASVREQREAVPTIAAAAQPHFSETSQAHQKEKVAPLPERVETKVVNGFKAAEVSTTTVASTPAATGFLSNADSPRTTDTSPVHISSWSMASASQPVSYSVAPQQIHSPEYKPVENGSASNAQSAWRDIAATPAHRIDVPLVVTSDRVREELRSVAQDLPLQPKTIAIEAVTATSEKFPAQEMSRFVRSAQENGYRSAGTTHQEASPKLITEPQHRVVAGQRLSDGEVRHVRETVPHTQSTFFPRELNSVEVRTTDRAGTNDPVVARGEQKISSSVSRRTTTVKETTMKHAYVSPKNDVAVAKPRSALIGAKPAPVVSRPVLINPAAVPSNISPTRDASRVDLQRAPSQKTAQSVAFRREMPVTPVATTKAPLAS